MAENKNIILFYKDWGSIFDKLNKDEKADLIQHFCDYIRDQDPEPPNRLTELLFEPIKTTLKRDLKKWEAQLDGSVLKGREGNLKRWHVDLYKLYKKDKITLEDAEKEAHSRKISGGDRKASGGDEKHRDPAKNIAVTVTVRDTVTVTDTVNSHTHPPALPSAGQPVLNLEIGEKEQRLIKYISEQRPHVAKMKVQLTGKDATYLLKKFDRAMIKEVIDEMNNWAPLTRKNLSVKDTIANWCRRRIIKNNEVKTIKQNGVASSSFLDAPTGER